MMQVWTEKNPIRGNIRRKIRSASQWVSDEVVPAFIDLTAKLVATIMIMVIIATILTNRERTSGPDASLSPRPSFRLSSENTPGLDPFASAIRADQGHFVSGVER